MSIAANAEFPSDFVRNVADRRRAEGKAEEGATAVLIVLAARSVDVPDEEFDRITECRDLDELDTWIRRAVTATSVDDLFDS